MLNPSELSRHINTPTREAVIRRLLVLPQLNAGEKLVKLCAGLELLEENEASALISTGLIFLLEQRKNELNAALAEQLQLQIVTAFSDPFYDVLDAAKKEQALISNPGDYDD
jgi:hypothetical protein